MKSNTIQTTPTQQNGQLKSASLNKKQRISEILKVLNEGLFERSETLAITLLSALAEQNIFLYGPPGTAKSLISRRLSKVFDSNQYFEHLMQKFSTPEEVFGPISISELKKDNYLRKTKGFLPEAEFAFLDEIWKSSPAILNTLLTIINEKKFKNGAEVLNTPLKVLISASNEVPPANQGLEALYDRFLTRLYVGPIEDRINFETVLQNGSTSSEITIPNHLKISNDELQKWYSEINNVKLPTDTLNIINGIRLELEKFNKKKKENPIYVSDRRWQKAATLLKASAYFCDRDETNIADCLLLQYCLWTMPENRIKVSQLINNVVKTNGFQTSISMLAIDSEKEALEQEIHDELHYTTDIYKTDTLKDSSIQYFKCIKEIEYNRYRDTRRTTFYIPAEMLKQKESFHPVDSNGNEIKWIKANFINQGVCQIKVNKMGKSDSYYLDNESYFESTSQPFKPKVLFHKGDKKEKVNERLINALVKGVNVLASKIKSSLNEVEKMEKEYKLSIATPFLSEEQLNLTIISISEQKEEIELRLKDCDRLLNMIE